MNFKKIFLCVTIVLFSIVSNAQYRYDYSDLNDSDVVKALKEHVSFIASAAMEGRKAGSEGETETAKYVYDKLTEYGVEMLSPSQGDVFGISRSPGDTLTSRNVVGFIQGYDKSVYDRYIVIGARMDNLGVNHLTIDGKPATQIYYGANGNASGLAMMMELARMISTNSLLFRRSIIFIGFGASEEGFAGSWYFLNRSFKDFKNIDAMINLDMVGGGRDNFSAYTAANQDMNRIVESLTKELQPILPEIVMEEAYPSDNRAFYAKGIPSIYFSTGKYVEHDTDKDTPSILNYKDMEDELEYIYNFSRTIANVQKAPAFSTDNGDGKGDDKVYPYYQCDTKPSFMGHYDPRWFLTNWVYQYMKYPKKAIENGIQGRVPVLFEIDKKGKVRNVRVTKNVDPLLEAEAIKVVEASPDWKPARIGSKKVNSYMELTIEFKLEKKSVRRGIKLKK